MSGEGPGGFRAGSGGVQRFWAEKTKRKNQKKRSGTVWAYFSARHSKSAYLGPSTRVCRGCFFSGAAVDTPSEDEDDA